MINLPNYLKKILEAAREKNPAGRFPAPGRVTHVTVEHDSWCGVYAGRPCDCDPNVVPGRPGENRNPQPPSH